MTGNIFAVRSIELILTLQHDREFVEVLFEVLFPFNYKTVYGFVMCNLYKRVIFTRGVLSIPASDVYVRLKTTGAAIKIARGTTNNQ